MTDCKQDERVPVNRDFMLAVVAGIEGIRTQADLIARDPATKADTSTGRMLREGVENKRQQADMLAGWVRRMWRVAGLETEDLPNV